MSEEVEWEPHDREEIAAYLHSFIQYATTETEELDRYVNGQPEAHVPSVRPRRRALEMRNRAEKLLRGLGDVPSWADVHEAMMLGIYIGRGYPGRRQEVWSDTGRRIAAEQAKEDRGVSDEELCSEVAEYHAQHPRVSWTAVCARIAEAHPGIKDGITVRRATKHLKWPLK